MSTDYEFTYDERAAIEQAAADHLAQLLPRRDAEELAYDIVSAVRGVIAAQALRNAAGRLDRVAHNEATDEALFEGLEHAADRLRDYADECATTD